MHLHRKKTMISRLTKEISFDLFSGLQWDMKMIGMEEGWKSGLTGKGVRVGIVDSGLSDYTMDIDRDRILKGKNLSPVKLNIGSPVLDTVGHGTFIAGIIGATKGNGIGIAGMAPGVTFAPVKSVHYSAHRMPRSKEFMPRWMSMNVMSSTSAPEPRIIIRNFSKLSSMRCRRAS